MVVVEADADDLQSYADLATFAGAKGATMSSLAEGSVFLSQRIGPASIHPTVCCRDLLQV